MKQIHKLALLIPAMTKEERKRLRDDIEANGLEDPVTTYQGKILDGRHRAELCDELGVKIDYEPYTGDSPAAFVVSRNIARRHLTKSQRDALAVELLPHFEREAKTRQRAAGRSHGRGQNSSGPIGPKLPGERAREEAAAAVGTSSRNVARAKRVREHAPDQFDAMKAGKVSTHGAEDEVRHRQRQRREATGKAQTWNVKTTSARARKIQAAKASKDHPVVRSVQLTLNKATQAIWGIEVVDDCALDEVSIDYAIEMYDDLVALIVAMETQIGMLTSRLGDERTLKTIAALRVTDGCTPPEKKARLAAANRLEKKLSQRAIGA